MHFIAVKGLHVGLCILYVKMRTFLCGEGTVVAEQKKLLSTLPESSLNDPTFLLFTSTDPSLVSNFNYKSLAFLYFIIPSRVMRGIEI